MMNFLDETFLDNASGNLALRRDLTGCFIFNGESPHEMPSCAFMWLWKVKQNPMDVTLHAEKGGCETVCSARASQY